MIFPPDLLDKLQSFKVVPWEGTVYRHMLGDYPPERSNTRGARWNPPDVAAIYTSLVRETAIAEAEYRLSLEPFRPRVKRVIYSIHVRLQSVLDLSHQDDLDGLGMSRANLEGLDLTVCQLVGGAVQWLGSDGMLVPSARHLGTNLVIYELDQSSESIFSVLASEVLPD